MNHDCKRHNDPMKGALPDAGERKGVGLYSLTTGGLATLALLVALLGLQPSRAIAGPLFGTACDDPVAVNADPTVTFVDCGTYISTGSGTSAPGPFPVTLNILGNDYVSLALYRSTGSPIWIGEPGFDITFNPQEDDEPQGAGAWTAPYKIMFIVIDGPGSYHIYAQGDSLGGGLYSGASSGFWATAPLEVSNSGGIEHGQNLANMSFFGLAPVPEPGPLGLMGLGMLGLALGHLGLWGWVCWAWRLAAGPYSRIFFK